MKEKNRKLALNLQLRIALMAAILAVTSQWAIPIGAVPITMQTFFVALCGALLGSIPGALALLVYLLIGACGLPVFSGFRGGITPFVSATGGFLWSFPIMAMLCGMKGSSKLWLQYAMGVLGLLVIYTAGTLQLVLTANMPLLGALSVAVFPFVIKDLVCVGFGIWVGRLIRSRLMLKL